MGDADFTMKICSLTAAPKLPLLPRLLPKLPLRLPKRKETAKEKETKIKVTKVKRSESAVMRMLSDTTVRTPRSELAKSLMVSQNGLSDIWATALGRKITSFKSTEWKNGTTD